MTGIAAKQIARRWRSAALVVMGTGLLGVIYVKAMTINILYFIYLHITCPFHEMNKLFMVSSHSQKYMGK